MAHWSNYFGELAGLSLVLLTYKAERPDIDTLTIYLCVCVLPRGYGVLRVAAAHSCIVV